MHGEEKHREGDKERGKEEPNRQENINTGQEMARQRMTTRHTTREPRRRRNVTRQWIYHTNINLSTALTSQDHVDNN